MFRQFPVADSEDFGNRDLRRTGTRDIADVHEDKITVVEVHHLVAELDAWPIAVPPAEPQPASPIARRDRLHALYPARRAFQQ